MSGDILSVVEAAYAEAEDPDAWLRSTFAAVHPHLERGAGVCAHRFAHKPDGFWVGTPLAAGCEAPRYLPIWKVACPGAPTVTTIRALLGEAWGKAMASLVPRERGRSLRLPRDAFVVIASDPSGHGCVFFAQDFKRVVQSRGEVALWQRIAAHLAAGYRLARRRADEAPDAVLDPVGKVRGNVRRVDPERALSLWKGLVADRWSLVEHFDHDGKRLVVAKRNALPLRPWKALTEREAQTVAFVAEGQTLKLVAYRLGVSMATVTRDLQRAGHKLGVTSRLQLVSAHRAQNWAGEGP
jgi:DNA-binding CsgD family transcriptional regulator